MLFRSRRVELVLPETGVCSADGDCCGPSAVPAPRLAFALDMVGGTPTGSGGSAATTASSDTVACCGPTLAKPAPRLALALNVLSGPDTPDACCPPSPQR